MTGCACDRALDTEQHARDIPRRNTTQLRVVSRQPDSEARAHANSLIRRRGRRPVGGPFALGLARRADVQVEHLAVGVVVGLVEDERPDADAYGFHRLVPPCRPARR